MPVGVIINAFSVLCGGLIGAVLGDKIPEKIRVSLPLIFGLSSMGMGIASIIKMSILPVVVLSVILGTAIGELFKIEEKIQIVAQKARGPIEKLTSSKSSSTSNQSEAEFMNKFIAIVILFCASGTGIFGSLTEGMTGDPTTLITKSILDFFTAAIFATSLGYIVATVAIPQIIVLLILFLSAGFIMPLTTPSMIANFSAAGGMLMLATGFRISGIKSFAIANMLPALVIVMPISYLWTTFVA